MTELKRERFSTSVPEFIATELKRTVGYYGETMARRIELEIVSSMLLRSGISLMIEAKGGNALASIEREEVERFVMMALSYLEEISQETHERISEILSIVSRVIKRLTDEKNGRK